MPECILVFLLSSVVAKIFDDERGDLLAGRSRVLSICYCNFFLQGRRGGFMSFEQGKGDGEIGEPWSGGVLP